MQLLSTSGDSEFFIGLGLGGAAPEVIHKLQLISEITL